MTVALAHEILHGHSQLLSQILKRAHLPVARLTNGHAELVRRFVRAVRHVYVLPILALRPHWIAGRIGFMRSRGSSGRQESGTPCIPAGTLDSTTGGMCRPLACGCIRHRGRVEAAGPLGASSFQAAVGFPTPAKGIVIAETAADAAVSPQAL